MLGLTMKMPCASMGCEGTSREIKPTASTVGFILMTEREIQQHAIEKLGTDGYVYWFPPRTWGERDIMGAWDFIAFKKRATILVQLTTRHHIGDRVKKITNLYRETGIYPRGCQVWGWDEGRGKFIIKKL